jgi:hydrogenase-4 component E
MHGWYELPLILLILTNLRLLGSSRLGSCIRTVAAQGVLLAWITLVCWKGYTLHTLLLVAGSGMLKGVIFPWWLFRVLREARVQREVEPFVGFTLSVLIGIVLLLLSLRLGARLPLPNPAVSSLVVPTALFTMLSGIYLLISRKKALTQALGYLVLENGIFAFSVALVHSEPFLVEMGILLDVFLAVFLMGIAIYHISREFNHIDTDQLTSLRDMP